MKILIVAAVATQLLALDTAEQTQRPSLHSACGGPRGGGFEKQPKREEGRGGAVLPSLLRIKVECVFQALGGWLFLFLHSISALAPNHIMSHYRL